jgi:uncharacterized protein
VAEWLYLLHPPRDDFAATMTDAERATFTEHRDHLERLHDAGALILAGPTLRTLNTGITVGEPRPFRATFLRGRV